MATLRPASLQGRLLWLVVGLVFAVWLAAGVSTWFDVRHELDELLDGHLAQAAALLVVRQTAQHDGDDDDDERGVDAPVLHRYAPQVAFQVFHEGRLAMRSANAPVLPMVNAGQTGRTGFETVRIDGADWRVFAAQGAEHDVQVYVGERADSRQNILWAVLRSTLWPMLVALPLLVLAAGWAVHSGLAPLRRLGSTLAGRAPQDLHPVKVADAPAEMAPMLGALNGLFERIDRLMASERRFTADAAHELRTPIAAIRAQAQVALAESADAPRRHALLATLEGCDRATRVVEQLLLLARLEAGAAQCAQPVDLGALLRQVVADLAPQALARQTDIVLEVTAASRVLGDATLFALLARNLIDNAIRYSPLASQVRVSLQRRAEEVLLAVEDSGPALAEADLQRLGERFFRVAGTAQSGSGLGWSIVRRIADAQQARVHVGRSTDLGGLAVEVAWWAAP